MSAFRTPAGVCDRTCKPATRLPRHPQERGLAKRSHLVQSRVSSHHRPICLKPRIPLPAEDTWNGQKAGFSKRSHDLQSLALSQRSFIFGVHALPDLTDTPAQPKNAELRNEPDSQCDFTACRGRSSTSREVNDLLPRLGVTSHAAIGYRAAALRRIIVLEPFLDDNARVCYLNRLRSTDVLNGPSCRVGLQRYAHDLGALRCPPARLVRAK
jgi:hypothetical protein